MTIRTGDLVMVMRPTKCCENPEGMGTVFKAKEVRPAHCYCSLCGEKLGVHTVVMDDENAFAEGMLKKIDPPAHGDSLPTRADIEVAT